MAHIDINDYHVTQFHRKAMQAAINKTLEKVRVNVKRELVRRYNLKPSYANRYLKVVPISSGRDAGYVICENVELNLTQFPKTKETGQGVTVQIKNQTTFPGAFIATMQSGHRSVFSRTKVNNEPMPYTVPRKGRYHGQVYKRKQGMVGSLIKRQQLREIKGPNLRTLFTSRDLWNVMLKTVAKELPTEYTRAFKHFTR